MHAAVVGEDALGAGLMHQAHLVDVAPEITDRQHFGTAIGIRIEPRPEMRGNAAPSLEIAVGVLHVSVGMMPVGEKAVFDGRKGDD